MGGSEGVWVGSSGFPLILGKVQVPPPQGGVSAFLGVWAGGSLSLVDHQHCSWAEARCDTSVHASSCGKLCSGMKKHFFLQVGHSNAGDET